MKFVNRDSLSKSELLEFRHLCDEGVLDALVELHGGTHRDAYEVYKGRDGNQKTLL